MTSWPAHPFPNLPVVLRDEWKCPTYAGDIICACDKPSCTVSFWKLAVIVTLLALVVVLLTLPSYFRLGAAIAQPAPARPN